MKIFLEFCVSHNQEFVSYVFQGLVACGAEVVYFAIQLAGK
jgi:hypothetical protein